MFFEKEQAFRNWGLAGFAEPRDNSAGAGAWLATYDDVDCKARCLAWLWTCVKLGGYETPQRLGSLSCASGLSTNAEPSSSDNERPCPRR